MFKIYTYTCLKYKHIYKHTFLDLVNALELFCKVRSPTNIVVPFCKK